MYMHIPTSQLYGFVSGRHALLLETTNSLHKTVPPPRYTKTKTPTASISKQPSAGARGRVAARPRQPLVSETKGWRGYAAAHKVVHAGCGLREAPALVGGGWLMHRVEGEINASIKTRMKRTMTPRPTALRTSLTRV